MSPSPESIAIQTPLSVVADIFSQCSSSRSSHDAPSSRLDGANDEHQNFHSRVSSHFQKVLADHLDAIPFIHDVCQSGRLARFRCMVQDTGLPNEVYVLDVGGENGRGCCAYSEGAASGSPILGYETSDYSKLRERQVIYATSIPGETEWYRKSQEHDLSPSSSAEALADQLSTRLHVNDGFSANSTQRTAGPTSGQIQHRAGHPISLRDKFPLPGASHTGALVKLYPSDDGSPKQEEATAVKATEIVDFIGIVDFSYFPSSASLEEAHQPDGTSSSQPAAALEQVKTLHAIYRLPSSATKVESQSVPSSPVTLSQGSASDGTSSRSEIIQHLTGILEGDKIAAEWLLLSLVGRTYARRGSLAIGQLPINIVLPSSVDSTSTLVKKIFNFLQSILPRLVKLDFELNQLNKVSYSPESKDENLISGILQLPEGTTLLVDETGMGEGTLQDRGVKNVQALANVINDQTLAYVFPYSSFTFETDLRVIVVSQGKSLLPMECVIPVRPSTSSTMMAGETPSAAQLASWRTLLSNAQHPPDFSIPESMSERIQSDFVKMRQNKSVTQEDLVLRMTVARLLALSQGKTELDAEAWDATTHLDEVRKARLAK